MANQAVPVQKDMRPHAPITPPTAKLTPLNPQMSTTPTPPLDDSSEPTVAVRNADIVAGFTRAITSLQPQASANWTNAEGAATVLANAIPRITTARLIVWCRDQKESLEVMAAKVLVDALTMEPGLLELTPDEAAEDGMALIQTMWPQAAFQPRRPPVSAEKPLPDHPAITKIKKLSDQWHRLALIPLDQAKGKNPTAWRRKVLNDIAMAKGEGLAAGFTRDQIMKALESSGDRWSWDVPPASRVFNNDEFGSSPPMDEDMTTFMQPA